MKFINIKRKTNLILSAALLLFVSLGLSSCENENELDVERQWQLVWEDDFDGSAGDSVDPSNWSFDIGNGCDAAAGCGWGNAELQYYTDRPDNISLDGQGNLAITAKRENFAGAAYTSARITTKDKFDQQYGRFEARIKMPWGPGLWPAFWMLGSNIDVVEWPQCGEIDIVEYRGQEPNLVHGTVHGPGYNGFLGNAVSKLFGFEDDRFDTDFHVFAIEWGENYIDYLVDDTRYSRIQPEDVTGEWVFDQPFYMLLNVAVGGNFVGFPAPGTEFPQTMLVDYIRVYQEVNQ